MWFCTNIFNLGSIRFLISTALIKKNIQNSICYSGFSPSSHSAKVIIISEKPSFCFLLLPSSPPEPSLRFLDCVNPTARPNDRYRNYIFNCFPDDDEVMMRESLQNRVQTIQIDEEQGQ